MTAPLWLLMAVALIAALYASVGLGGATAYAAILSLAGIPLGQIAPLVLALNLVVAGWAFWGRHRVRLVPVAALRPLLLGSVPGAFLGGLLPVREREFLLLLAAALLLASLRFLIGPSLDTKQSEPEPAAPGRQEPLARSRWAPLLALGAGLGLLAGMTGIGGGVYLGPILLLAGWGDLRTTPGLTSGFVVLNSIAGLAAHLTRLQPVASLWVPLVVAVAVGAAVSTVVSLRRSSTVWTQRALGLALLAVAVLNGARAL